jgi:hypothetical protein
MRDRGISSPLLKSVITGALAVSGAAASTWGMQAPDPALRAAAVARTLGATVGIVALLMTANYLYAWFLIRRMRRGEDVIGRWTVAPDTFAKFSAIERARTTRRNNWRVPRTVKAGGLEVIFTRRSVVVGSTWFRLAAKGMTRFANARIENGGVPSIEYSMRLTIVGAGSLSQTARYKGHLRIPIADDASVEAARVLAHFRGLV